MRIFTAPHALKFSAIKPVAQEIVHDDDEIRKIAKESGDTIGISVMNPHNAFLATGEDAQRFYQAHLRMMQMEAPTEADELEINGTLLDRAAVVETWEVKPEGQVDWEDDLDVLIQYNDATPEQVNRFAFLTTPK